MKIFHYIIGDEVAVVQTTVADVTEAGAAAAVASTLASTEVVTVHSQRSSLSKTPEECKEDEDKVESLSL